MGSSNDAADTLVADLRTIFGSRLISIVVYGPHAEGEGTNQPMTCLALVGSLNIADLEGCARRSAAWRREGLATPLILPEAEFHRSLDAFPLEYGEIVRAHRRVFGPDPFADAVIAPEDLRRACETQVKSHLVHLREGFVEAAGRPHELARLVTESAPAFAALLRNVAQLHGCVSRDRVTVTTEGGRLAGLADSLVGSMLALEQPATLAPTDGARLFPEYLAAVEQLARFVDTWRGQLRGAQ